MFLVNNTTVQTLRPCKELGFTLVGLSKLRNLLSLMSSQPATDYLRQAAHFISYATFLHLKHYGSALMAPTKSAKARVHWTEEEISALVDYLHAHRSEGEGGSFKKQTFQGAVIHLQPLHKQGAQKDANSVKEKFTKVSASEAVTR